MELLQLKYFCDAAHTENFSATAKKYGVPTSAVSQSINRLEKEIGASFFSRRANSIKLNKSGKEFYLKVSSALALLDDAVSSASASGKRKTLNICIDAKRRHMQRIVEEFKQMHRDIDANIKHVFNLADDGNDIIIADSDIDFPGYTKHLIISEGLAIAIHKSHPLAVYKKLTVDMLKNEPFIAMNEQRPMHTVVMNICADFGFVPHITLQSDDPDYVGRLVSLGMGVAIVPESHSPLSFSEDVIFHPIKGYARNIYAYVLQSKELLPYVKDFLNLLKEI